MAAAVAVSYNSSNSSSEDELCDRDYLGEDVEPLSGAENDDSMPCETSIQATGAEVSRAPRNAEAVKHEGMAAVMAKILAKQLPTEFVTPILAKAKTEKQIIAAKKKEIPEGEPLSVAPSNDVQYELPSKSDPVAKEESAKPKKRRLSKLQKKRKAENLCRVKPKVTERNFERILQKTAARGVVQLFNAVRQQQKQIDDKLQAAGSSEIRREKVLQSVSKGSFLDMLKATGSTATTVFRTAPKPEEAAGAAGHMRPLGSGIVEKGARNGSRGTATATWSVLRDDFMMGSAMKNWDKESDGSHGDSGGDH